MCLRLGAWAGRWRPWGSGQEGGGAEGGPPEVGVCVCVTSVRSSGCDVSSRLLVTSLGQQHAGHSPSWSVTSVAGCGRCHCECVFEWLQLLCLERGRGEIGVSNFPVSGVAVEPPSFCPSHPQHISCASNLSSQHLWSCPLLSQPGLSVHVYLEGTKEEGHTRIPGPLILLCAATVFSDLGICIVSSTFSSTSPCLPLSLLFFLPSFLPSQSTSELLTYGGTEN